MVLSSEDFFAISVIDMEESNLKQLTKKIEFLCRKDADTMYSQIYIIFAHARVGTYMYIFEEVDQIHVDNKHKNLLYWCLKI